MHLCCFFLVKIVAIYALLVCKNFGAKIRSCKFFDKSQVCKSICRNGQSPIRMLHTHQCNGFIVHHMRILFVLISVTNVLTHFAIFCLHSLWGFRYLSALAQACGFFWACFCFCLLALDHLTVVAMFYVFIEVKKVK